MRAVSCSFALPFSRHNCTHILLRVFATRFSPLCCAVVTLLFRVSLSSSFVAPWASPKHASHTRTCTRVCCHCHPTWHMGSCVHVRMRVCVLCFVGLCSFRLSLLPSCWRPLVFRCLLRLPPLYSPPGCTRMMMSRWKTLAIHFDYPVHVSLEHAPTFSLLMA